MDYIIYVVVPIVVSLVVNYGLRYLDKKTNGTKYEKLVDWIADIVDVVEKTEVGSKLGTVKKDKAMQLVKKLTNKTKIPLSDDMISKLIDEAVDLMNKKEK